MTEQYQMGSLVMRYLKELDVHPINIGQAVSNENYRKSYQLIQENPKISKEEFLTAMGIEEWEESQRSPNKEMSSEIELTLTQKLLIYGLTLFPLTEQEQKEIFLILKTDEKRERLILFLKLNEKATAQEIKEEVSRIIE